MDSSQMLRGKRALVFGAGGSIGAAVAKEFASEGAQVFLSGRTRSTVEEVARQIARLDGQAHAEVLDALDDAVVNAYVQRIAEQIGPIDVVFNAIGPRASEYANGTHAIDLMTEQFMVPLTTIVRSQFVTARAAARQMVRQRRGVILFLTGSPARGHVEGATAIGAAFGALETLTENLAFELGPHCVRVVCLRTVANVDSRVIQSTMDAIANATNAPRDQMIERIAAQNFLKMPATVADTAKAAAFLASDRARLFTGAVVNSTAGAALD